MDRIRHWFINLKLINKITYLFVFIAIVVFSAELTSYYYDSMANKLIANIYLDELTFLHSLEQTRADIRANEANMYNLLLTKDYKEQEMLIANIEKRINRWRKTLKNYRKDRTDPYEIKSLTNIDQNILQYRIIRSNTIKLALSGEPDKAYQYYQSNKPVLDNLTKRLQNLSDYNLEKGNKSFKSALKYDRSANFISSFGVIIALIIAIIIGFFIVKKITDSLDKVIINIERLANGKFDVSELIIDSHDEIGKLSETFNLMTTNLRNVEETKETFTATLTHDLRSPLNAIQKALEAILAGKLGASLDDLTEYLRDIYNTNQELLLMVNNILSTYHYEKGKYELQLEEVNITELINISATSMKPLAKAQESDIITNIEPDLPLILGTRDEVLRVVNNLVSNAIKHNTKGTTINLKAKRINNDIKVAISDNGKGIPEEEKLKIFQKYPTTKRQIGTGLGLYISKQIIEALNGKIWFETEENIGTTFYFTLPIANVF